MSSAKRDSEQVDRQTTTPFHLKLFYRLSSFHHLIDFPIPTSSNPSPLLPQHLQIYTWPTCTLLELSHLLTTALPNLLPSPAIGTRLSFRLIYPDTRPLPPGRMREDDSRGRWTSREMGSVVVVAEAADTATDQDETNGDGDSGGVKFHNTEEAERSLADSRFVIGDYIDCAIFPPLADGSVAPRESRGSYAGGAGPIGTGSGRPSYPRENGYGRPRPGAYAPGRGDGPVGGNRGGDFGGARLPPGEWRRGERLPDGGYGRGYGNRGRGRGGY